MTGKKMGGKKLKITAAIAVWFTISRQLNRVCVRMNSQQNGNPDLLFFTAHFFAGIAGQSGAGVICSYR
jgi:hypothetical protein